MADAIRFRLANGTIEPKITFIKADILIPGRGEPQKDAALVSNQGSILYVGPQSSIPSEYAILEAIHVPVLMPGLWDCHVHFFGTPHYSPGAVWNLNLAVAGARSVRDAAELINAGYTSVRECAGHGLHLDEVMEEGSFIGPKIYSCGAIISQTGGHADAHTVPLSAWLNACDTGLPCHQCDGVDECLKAVRLQLRNGRGAKFIKICASGGIGSEFDNPSHQQYSDEEIKAFVDEAGRADRIVAAHCHGKRGIMAALKAGVHTIEHGTELDEESMALMIEKGAILVPTRVIMEVVLQLGHIMTPMGYQKMLKIAPVHQKAYSAAIKAGVKIALGSDLGISMPGSIAAHGKNALEIKYAVDAGMTPLQAIEATTATAPETLGLQGPSGGSGQLKVGYEADFIAVSRSPLEDIEVLTNTENITHVWRRGKLCKSPECPAVSALLK